MSSRVRHLIAPAAVLAALVAAAPAQASSSEVIKDCASDGSVDGNYSQGDLQGALNNLPADVDSYSDCRSSISSLLGGGDGKKASGGGGSGGSSAPLTPAQRAKRARIARREAKQRVAERRRAAKKAKALAFAGPNASPRDAAVFRAADTANGLPTPLLAALIALALLAATGGLLTLRRRSPRFAGALSQVSLQRLRRVGLPRFRR